MSPRARRVILGSLLVGLLLAIVALTAAVVFLPRFARQLVVWQLEGYTQRSVTIDALDVSLRTGRFSVRGFRVNDPDGGLLARFDSLEGRLHRRSIVQGHVWIEELVLTNGHVRIVRTGPDRFNISDLLDRPREPRGAFAFTLDHLSIVGGSVEVEDRVLTPARTWRSQDIRLEARDVGTSARKGIAVGSTTVAGALVNVRVSELQLYPIHLRADVNVRDLDLTLVNLYLPPGAGVDINRGVVDAMVSITNDAKEGFRLGADAVVRDFALTREDLGGEAVAAPALQIQIVDLHQRPGVIALRYASLGADSLTVLDPTTSPPTRRVVRDLTFTASDLEQPMKDPAKIALHALLPGTGEVDVVGTAGLAPRSVDLRVRARDFELATLGRYLPLQARFAGTGVADLHVVARDDTTPTVGVTGDATLRRVSVTDAGTTPLAAATVAVKGLAYTYPATVRVADLTITDPSVIVERDASGALNLAALGRRRDGAAPAPPATTRAPAPIAVDVAVARLSVIDGRARVSDDTNGGRLEARDVDVTAQDVTWPSKGPARVRLAAEVARGRVTTQGTVDVGPQRADLTVTARNVDLATFQPWLPPAVGRVRGMLTEADVTVALGLQPLTVAATGKVGGSDLVWNDGTRPEVKVARVSLRAEDVTWPSKGPARIQLSADAVGGRITARGTVDVGPQSGELTVTAQKVNLATLQPWLPPAAGRVRGMLDEADVKLAGGLQPLSVAATGRIATTDLVWNDGTRPEVNVPRLTVRAEDFTWPSKGAAKVRAGATVAGGRVTARGTVDAGTRRADLAVKATGMDLATLQPWLPISGQLRGVAEADVTVAGVLEPLNVEVRGTVGTSDLAFLEGTKPLLTVKRVDLSGIDAAWPTKLSIDRLRVNTPWAEIARNTQGELSLRALFRPRPGKATTPGTVAAAAASPEAGATVAGPIAGMQLSVREAIFENGGARIIDDAVEPAARFDMAGSRLELRSLTWPARGNAQVQMTTPMPGGGTMKARGTFSIEPTKLALEAELDQIDLGPGRPYLPFEARLNGKLTGRAKIDGTFTDTIKLVVEGDATVDRPRLGDLDRQLVRADKVEMTDFRYSYPTSIRIRQLAVRKPWMLVERNSDGSLDLLALFKPKGAAGAAGAGAITRVSTPPSSTPRPDTKPAPEARVRVVVNKLVMDEGFVRFVDRTTEPAYAEELIGIQFTGESIGTARLRPNAPPREGSVDLNARFASGTPLALRGKIGGITGPLFLDVKIDVADFPLPRLNPYLDRLSAWIAKQGTLTTTLGLKVDGDELDVDNQIRVDGLQLEPGGRGGEFRKRTGLPLDTLTSLLKDRQGVIKLHIPVSGRLSSPDFHYSEAVWAALRNLSIRLVALPFSLVGKLFFTEDSRIEALQVDPVTFQVATATPDAKGAEQLNNLVKFLRETPAVRLRVRPVTTVPDVAKLRREALDARLATLGADEAARRQAAVGLYTELFPRREPPADDTLYDELSRETPMPPRALRTLATERVAAVRDALVRAGIAAERLEPQESRTAVEGEGNGRVEFELRDAAQ